MKKILLTLIIASSFANADDTQKVFDEYCVKCHNFEDFSGGFEIEGQGVDDIAQTPELAEKIIKRLQSGLMPPAGEIRPDNETTQSLAKSLEQAVDSNAEVHLPAPGLHRLNRNEYSNAINDILGIRVDSTKFLPSDDSSHGFDNIADALSSSPALLEAYLSAAGRVSRLALGLETEPTLAVFDAPPDTSQNTHIEGLPFGTRGGLLIDYVFPSDGEYVFTVKGMTGYFTRVLGNVTGEQLEVTIDGERIYLYDWDKEIGPKEGLGGKTPPISIKGGYHKVGVTFIITSDLPDDRGVNVSWQRTMNSPGALSGYTFYPHVGQVFIEGPFNGAYALDTASRRKIFECYPTDVSQENACATQIISTIVTKAYRRPANKQDINTVMDFYKTGREEGGSFDHGIQSAIQRILTDSEFIFRSEVPRVEEGIYTISDLELASRLSFFLWSTIPDQVLLDLANKNILSVPAVLQQQVNRMLQDPKSQQFIKNFTGQWLNTRGMAAKEPVVDLFPDFDSTLRDAFTKEIELLFESAIKDDLSALDLLNANYTFLNERLAKHYGIPDIYGEQFRKVELPPEFEYRRGLLGKGALLTITSEATRTSPVKRGKWFLETFYGISPPDPPPGVETNLEPVDGETLTTLRARLEQHRADPSCASCHKLFEPMGMAMENYDAVGVWRTIDNGNPIDPTGVTPDGITLDGANNLRELTLFKGDMFAETVIDKMLTYALGRGLEVEDMPLIRKIRDNAREQDYKFSAIIMRIVLSPAFTHNKV
jgi:hypothetical protein